MPRMKSMGKQWTTKLALGVNEMAHENGPRRHKICQLKGAEHSQK